MGKNKLGKSELNALAQRINQEHQSCEESLKQGLKHALDCGKLLLEAKKLVQHGEWLAWVRDNCKFSERTAQVYMRVTCNVPLLEKTQRVTDLSFREAVKLLSDSGGDHFDKGSWDSIEWTNLSDNEFTEIIENEIVNWPKRIAAMQTRFDDVDRLPDTEKLAELNHLIDEASYWGNRAAEMRIRAERRVGKILNDIEEGYGKKFKESFLPLLNLSSEELESFFAECIADNPNIDMNYEQALSYQKQKTNIVPVTSCYQQH